MNTNSECDQKSIRVDLCSFVVPASVFRIEPAELSYEEASRLVKYYGSCLQETTTVCRLSYKNSLYFGSVRIPVPTYVASDMSSPL